MFDLFAIFSKGGIVLWYFHDLQSKIEMMGPINALITSVILQEKSTKLFHYGNLVLEYKLDNEFELVFVVGYQKILSLSYVDKFLSIMELEFRDRYKDVLLNSTFIHNFNDFEPVFSVTLREIEESSRREARANKEMRSFEDSQKSKKTVASMIKSKTETVNTDSIGGKKIAKKGVGNENGNDLANKDGDTKNISISSSNNNVEKENGGSLSMEELERNRLSFLKKRGMSSTGTNKNKDTKKQDATDISNSPQSQIKRKTARVWDQAGSKKDESMLDFSATKSNGADHSIEALSAEEVQKIRGHMTGILRDVADDDVGQNEAVANAKSGGMFGIFKTLVGGKMLTAEDLLPVLEKFRDHLIFKNVAKDTAEQIVDSVSEKLIGKNIGTFSSVQSTVRACLEETCLRLLTPHRRVDILRDAEAATETGRPYVVVFCGVNGVGKSTNLAKIAFWLLENGRRVMIAACDTFRSGAIEQLRTHLRRLQTLHPNRVELYGQEYGSNASAVARNAISEAKRRRFDVVLVDTAGRMQDNGPLMFALAKLIHENTPDRVLFVGEALVGNEAIDQLKKFNEALVDMGRAQNDRPQSIDGIILTKFDTVDDKVGAALSMTHHSGQPIVMVGTGQTYTDLKALSAKAVVNALLR